MAPKCEPLCHFGDRYTLLVRNGWIALIQHRAIFVFRLYFTTFPNPPPSAQSLNRLSTQPGNAPRVRARPRGGPSTSSDEDATYYYFTIDDQLLYLSFFQDWGPLNLAMVYKACILIHELLEVTSTTAARLTVVTNYASRP